MKKLILMLIATTMLALGAHAKTYQLPEEDAEATVKIPDSWDVEQGDEDLSATSEDEEVSIYAEVLDEDQIEGAVLENIGYLKKHKVTVNEKSKEKTEAEINGLKALCYAMTGKDEDGVCNISLIFYQLGDKRVISMLYWAPEKVDKEVKDQVQGILNSVKAK